MWSPKGPSTLRSPGIDKAFEHELRFGRHPHVDGFALNDFKRLASARNPAKMKLADGRRQRRSRCINDRGIAADGNGHFHALARGFIMLVVARSVLVLVPVHARGLVVIDLHAVHADVRDLRDRIDGADHGKGDKPSAVCGPALEHGDFGKVDLIAGKHDLLAGGFFHGLGEEGGEFGKLRQHLDLVHDPGAGAGEQVGRIDDFLDPLPISSRSVDLERKAHALHGAESIGQDRERRAFYPFEQKGLVRGPLFFRDPVGDFGDLKLGIDFRLDPDQFAFFSRRAIKSLILSYAIGG